MTVAFYMNCVSTHQLPLAREVAKLVDSGQCVVDSNFVYVYEGEGDQAYQRVDDVGDVKVEKVGGDGQRTVEDSDLVVSGLRDLELFERRAKKGLKTFYTSERWFKPPLGRFRLLVPGYRRMVKRFVTWANSDPGARVLAIGPWAKRDFLKMGITPEKIVDWGYFVESSRFGTRVPAAHAELDETCVPTPLPAAGRHAGRHDCVSSSCDPRVLRVLWAGRDIPLKHVRDIERAVALANKNLKCPSLNTHHSSLITFTKLTGVSPAQVREAMREHDVFVFASNGYEGWGAVVSEALEEGMNVIGTWECGACPTLLPKERLYHCGDVKALAELLESEYRGELPACSIGEWTAVKAARRLINLI